MVGRIAAVALLLPLLVGCGSDGSKCNDANEAYSCSGGGPSGGSAGASGGGVASTAGAPGGGASSAGTSSGGASTGGASSGGEPAGGKGPMVECPPECLVAITCVKQCGGTPVSVGCCPCVEPAFDARQCN